MSANQDSLLRILLVVLAVLVRLPLVTMGVAMPMMWYGGGPGTRFPTRPCSVRPRP